MVSRQNGKGDLGHTVPVLTAEGWKTHGDLQPGDYVYGSDGKLTRIVAVSPEYTDSECYRVAFTDGSSVIAGDGHLWAVRNRSKKVAEVLSTEVLASSVGGRRPDNGRMEYNWRVRCDTQLDAPEVDLPIDPYLLGYWLGDGYSASGDIAVGLLDEEWVASRLVAAGAVITNRRTHDHGRARRLAFRIADKYSHDGFRGRAARLGILNDKRIPETYLNASIEQRKQLLAGLMDSDGSARMNTRSTQVEFCTVLPGLAEDFQTLVRSLGIRVTAKTGKAGYRDANGNLVECKDRYRFLWTPTFNPFQMPRKAALYVGPVSNRQAEMSITSIERVPTEPTRCIQVAAEDGIYLVGKTFIPTHNSILEAIELAGLLLFGERLIIHSAHEFRTAQNGMERLVALLRGSNVEYKAKASHGMEGVEILNGPNAGARVVFQTRTKGSGLGLTADRVILDEAMMITPESIQALMPTLSSRPNPQIIYTGSAVDQRIHANCEVFGSVRYRALDALRTGERVRLCYLEWSCEDGAKPDDPWNWAQSNPGLGYRQTIEKISDEYQAFKTNPRAFGTQRLGIGDWPAFGDDRSEIPSERWKAMENSPDLTGPKVVTLYRAPEGGPWSICGSQRTTDGRIHLEVGYVGTDPADAVVGKLVDTVAAWAPSAVIIGRGGAAAVQPELEAVGIEPIVPNLTDEAQACGGFLNDVFVDPPILSHSGQDSLNNAVREAVKRELNSGGFVWDNVEELSYAQLMGITLSRWALLKFTKTTSAMVHEWPSDEEMATWLQELEEDDDLLGIA